jgi:hypothetical protein
MHKRTEMSNSVQNAAWYRYDVDNTIEHFLSVYVSFHYYVYIQNKQTDTFVLQITENECPFFILCLFFF